MESPFDKVPNEILDIVIEFLERFPKVEIEEKAIVARQALELMHVSQRFRTAVL